MTDDAELLRQYVQTGSEDAFAELVHRHLPVVYSSALRQTDGDVELAKDICQTVFIDLGRKARSLLGHELVLGWLFAATRFTAASMLRGSRRRQIRESIAASMHEDPVEPAVEDPQLASSLDAAMAELPSEDRNAVLLRFFQGKELKEVGSALGISEDAARMRITRALDRLHGLLSQRGLTLSVAALGTALAAPAATAVPAGLAASIAATALATAAAGGGIPPTLAKLMTMTKVKFGIISVIVVAGVAVWLAVHKQSKATLGGEHRHAFASLRIEGTLTYWTPPDPRMPTNEEHYFFRLLVDEGKWNIQMIPVDAEKRAITYFEIGCDGETLYAYHEQNLDLIRKKMTNGVAVVPTTRGFAMIIPDTLPNPRFFRCEPLWLAYCSHPYFSTNSSGRARQIWLSGELSPSAVLDNIPVKATWNWLPKGRRYLSHVDYYARPDSSGSAPLPLVVYNVTRTKELEGVDVPTAFDFVRFSEIDLSNKTPFVTFSCRVTNVARVQPLLDPKPRISLPVMMMDYRFATETPPVPMLQQIVTNGSWPEKATVAASKQLGIARRIVSQKPPN
ncbi:MAG: sigma-70 family RNA polymerase sigma factor [Verrucomicrobia bacterium]|nr:sigma-70 family RNA polymerase sigma factor [Verrucomicrobiota bacterium]